MLPRWLVIALAILITLVWAANFIVGVIYPGRSEPYLNGIFAIVVGAVFTLGRTAPAGMVRRKLAKLVEPPQETTSQDDDRGGQP